MRKFSMLTACAVAVLLANSASASVLIGSLATGSGGGGSGKLSNGEINALVNTYNADASTPYTFLTVGDGTTTDTNDSVIGKFEDIGVGQGVSFNGSVGSTDLNLFTKVDSGGFAKDVFDTTLRFTGSGTFDVGYTLGFTVNNNVGWTYYTVKADGYTSLWAVVSGFNVAYTDNGRISPNNWGDSTVQLSVANDRWQYEPVLNKQNNGFHRISNVTFYSGGGYGGGGGGGGGGGVPEPASVVIWSLFGAGGLAFARRRKQKAADKE